MLHITNHSSSHKLAGFQSLNTSTLTNEFCIKMMKKTDISIICQECYAALMQKRYKNLDIAISKNGPLLSESPLPIRLIPVINAIAFRFHSLGELINLQHLENYATIAAHNPLTFFTLWTKRKDIVNAYFKAGNVKPDNLSFIFSSAVIGKIEKLPMYFDKVFTAHNKNTKETINCHSKCIDCMVCYSKNDTIYINEIKK
jgi:hypothetical protein